MTTSNPQRGFSLVELMVGLVIAILSSIVVFQVFSVSEKHKRTTTGAADAQSNGAVALYMMDRDIRMAGWGMEGNAIANCKKPYTYYEDASGVGGPITDFFASVSITDGGASGSDVIRIKYYGNPTDANIDFSADTLAQTMPQSSAELNVNRTDICKEGDLAFVMQSDKCTLMQITQVQNQALKLQHNPGTGGVETYNPPISYQNANNWPAYTGCKAGDSTCSSPASIQCFSALYRRTYSILNQGLILQEPDSTNLKTIQTYQITPDIVDLQAQYGVAPANSQSINEWVDATGATWATTTTTPTNDNIRRIKAVRIALLARSAQYEKPDASGNCTTTTAVQVSDWSTWNNKPVFATERLPADWQCYRYKIFETVIPLRNVIWAGV